MKTIFANKELPLDERCQSGAKRAFLFCLHSQWRATRAAGFVRGSQRMSENWGLFVNAVLFWGCAHCWCPDSSKNGVDLQLGCCVKINLGHHGASIRPSGFQCRRCGTSVPETEPGSVDIVGNPA